MPPKTLLEELDEIENGDEIPLSNRVFARFMRHMCSNHLSHMDGRIKSVEGKVETQKTVLFAVILPLLLIILGAIIGFGLTR